LRRSSSTRASILGSANWEFEGCFARGTADAPCVGACWAVASPADTAIVSPRANGARTLRILRQVPRRAEKFTILASAMQSFKVPPKHFPSKVADGHTAIIRAKEARRVVFACGSAIVCATVIFVSLANPASQQLISISSVLRA